MGFGSGLRCLRKSRMIYPSQYLQLSECVPNKRDRAYQNSLLTMLPPSILQIAIAPLTRFPSLPQTTKGVFEKRFVCILRKT